MISDLWLQPISTDEIPGYRPRQPPDRKPGQVVTPRVVRFEKNERRQALRRAGKCINSSPSGKPSRFGIVHGPANPKSGKCDRCERVAKLTRK